jgi:hypothetical protein
MQCRINLSRSEYLPLVRKVSKRSLAAELITTLPLTSRKSKMSLAAGFIILTNHSCTIIKKHV